MARSVLIVSAAVGVALGFVSAGTAHAGPPPPCTFTLSAPVVQGDIVTASIAPEACGPPAEPVMTVACLQVNGVTTCAPHRGPGNAQVRAPYVAGTTYVATGRGCGRWIGQTIAPDCQPLGPVSATL
jgi:hypothetical protein